MVSEKTKQIANLIEDSIRKSGVNYSDLSDLLDVAIHAIDNENDIAWSLKVTDYVKKCCEIGIRTERDILQLDALWWKVHKVEGPHIFESFLYYMEKNRLPEKKFYKPRERTLHVVVEDLQDLEDGKLDFLGISLPPRVGKLLADDTPVLTADGWKNHGDLKVGDRVVSPDGEYVRVQHVFPKDYADCLITFTNGEKIQCHENHEWVVHDRAFRRENLLSTREIERRRLEYGEPDKRTHRYVLQIQEKTPMAGEYRDLPVKPYSFGAWLGDGTNKKPRITICDSDMDSILGAVENDGYKVIHKYKQQGCTACEIADLKKDLRTIGLCHRSKKTNKYIPDIYFTASMDQRLELLAGLLDTDGTLNKKDHRYHYSTIDKVLLDGIVKLIATFGWRASVVKYEKKKSSSGIVGRHDVYCVGFNPTLEIPCRVERKHLAEFSKQRRIAIKSVDRVEKKRGNCIQVEGGMYLAGNTMIPTHNSTLCIFFLAWVIGKRKSSHNAMSGHSGILADRFYSDVMKLATSADYTFTEIFPDVRLENKSADKNELWFDKRESFASLTCRGIDGTWTGAVDISSDGYLYVDDMVRDRKESLSAKRLNDRYQDYLNLLVDRKNDGTRELMVGTRWNILDPLGRIELGNADNERYRFRKIPALNENNESNFIYDYGKGFSTEYFLALKKRLDANEWMAKYQQKPFVREGLLFPEDELRTFNGVLPEGDHRVFAACDVAWGGGDSLSMPIGYEYENGDVFIVDWVFNGGKKEITIPLVIGKIMGEGIKRIQFEGNNGGDMYKKYVDEKLEEFRYRCSCTDKKAPARLEKMSKIIAYSGYVISRFVFLDEDKRSGEYQKAMEELTMFVVDGVNTHDDAADGITQLAMSIDGGQPCIIKVMDGPFRRRS